MIGTELDDLPWREIQAGPPVLNLDLGDKQYLASAVDGVLDHKHDPTQFVLIALALVPHCHLEYSYPLAGAGDHKRETDVPLRRGEPVVQIFLARVPLDYGVHG